jgi:hypothetical protein
MDIPGIPGKRKSGAELNCRLICKQHVGSSSLPVGSKFEYELVRADASPPLRITKSSTNFSKNNVYSGLMLGLKNALQIRL